MKGPFTISRLIKVMLLCSFLHNSTVLYAENQVLGEIRFEGVSKVEKTSGVWIDGQYVGYLKELKGSKKVLLLRGEHEIALRQAGYRDFTRKMIVQLAEK